MATFTITTAINYQDLTWTTAVGNDTYRLEGGTLTIDTDTRYCTNHTAGSGNLGNVTISSSLGGSLVIDGTNVRLVPYNSGSGNVPAIGTTISQGGGTITGYLLGVWDTLASAPTAVGAAMPADGYIKFKNKAGGDFAAGAITGIGATATGADTAGWIEVVGIETTNCFVPRLGSVVMTGDWFVVGQTNGSSNQTIQMPASLANTYYPGVWIETAASSGVYEFYPNAGTATTTGTDEYRGKVVWISSQGLLRIGNSGAATNGYTPVTGLNIRVPNIVTINSNSATMTSNAMPHTTTLGNRYDFTTTSAGVISIDKANLTWYPIFQQAYSVNISNTGIMEQILVSEVASTMTWSHVGVGQTAAFANVALNMSTCLAGGTFSNCVWTRAGAGSGGYVESIADIDGFTFSNCKDMLTVNRTNNTSGVATVSRANNCVWNDQLLGGGRYLLTTCINCTFNDTVYYDNPGATGSTSYPMYAFDLSTACSNIVIDGFTIAGGLFLQQPYNGLLNVGTTANIDVKLRNVGSYASPLDLGGPQVADAGWTRSTTTGTVTSTGHGLKTGDIFYLLRMSDTAVSAIGSKTVGGSVDANRFTYAVSNAGSASGTLTYYPTRSAYVFGLAATAVANDVRVQRVYTTHNRTNLYTSDNSSKNILIENVYGDYVSAPVSPELNSELKGVGGTHALTAQTSCYGTHFFDIFTADLSTTTSAQSWSRSAAVITVTSTGHNLRTGLQVVITTTSDTSAIPRGIYSVTATSSSTFTFTGVAAGGTSGTLDYVPCVSRIGILMNEETSDTSAIYTIESGTPQFTSAGSLAMVTSGDRIIFETPEYIIGHTGFNVAEPVMGAGTLANFDITYAIDLNDGSGYPSKATSNRSRSSNVATITTSTVHGLAVGNQVTITGLGGTGYNTTARVATVPTTTTFTYANTGDDEAETADTGGSIAIYKNLSYPRTGAGGTSGQTNVTMTSTTGVAVGDYVYGTGVAYSAKVSSITDSTTIVVDIANTATVSGTLRFGNLPNESTINAQNGFKLKVRLQTSTTPNATALTSLYMHTLSTSTSRAYQYPLDLATITINNIVVGSSYEIYDDTTSTVIATGTASSTTVTASGVASNGDVIRVRVRKSSTIPKYVPLETQTVVADLEASVYVTQIADSIA